MPVNDRPTVISRRSELGSVVVLAAAPLPPVIAVPIEVKDGRCVVPMLLDGRRARMVVDTGAERTVVTRAAAARLGLRRDLWVDTPMVGAGGLLETHPNVDADSATIGGTRLFHELPGRGLSLSVTDLQLGDADGLLGGDLLRHYTLDLDMPQARLALRPAWTAPTGNVVAVQPWARGLLLAPLRLDGTELTALVDTGASRTLINARGLHRMGITAADAVRDPVVSASGLGGSFQAHLRQFGALQLGQTRFPNALLLIAAVPEIAFDMILGLDVLGQQRFLLSYASLRLGFIRRPGAPPHERESTGLM